MAWFGKKQRAARRSYRGVLSPGGEALEDRRLLAFDPSPFEQALMEHLNRMRTDPQGELDVYFKSTDPLLVRDAGALASFAGLTEIQRAVDHFNVDGTMLAAQFAALTPVAPLAWNELLITAAEKHNDQMLLNNDQQHQFPGELDLGGRLDAEGYNLSLALENVFAYAENDLYGHAGFAIDWGTGPGGIQTPAGHRDNIMNSQVQEVGIAVLETVPVDPDNDVGPFLITQDFGRRNDYQAQLVGVAWEDGKNDTNGLGLTGIYDPGEGYGGMTITAQGNGQIFTTTTMSAGGYQMVLPPGAYTVSIKGTFIFGIERAVTINMGTSNAKVDFEVRSSFNRRATANADTATVNENQSININVLSNDSDADGSLVASTLEIWEQPEHGTLSIATNGVVTYTPENGYSGADSFRYVVADNLGAFTAPATVNITVNDVNAAPVAVNSSFTATQGVATTHEVTNNVTDSDGTINWSTLQVAQQPASGTLSFNSTTRTFTYTSNGTFTGSDSFRYRVADNGGAFSNEATVTVTVDGVNDAPTAANDLLAARAGVATPLNVTANDTDPDSNLAAGSVAIMTAPTNGTTSINGVTITYTANSGFRGIDTLTYQVSDDDGAVSNTATVTIYVTAPLTPWQNPVFAEDVQPNSVISPLDAILVINNLGISDIIGGGPFAGLETAPPPFLDVNGNNAVDPLDALLVINRLGDTQAAARAALSSSASTAVDSHESRVEEVSSQLLVGVIQEPTRRLATRQLVMAGNPVVASADGVLSELPRQRWRHSQLMLRRAAAIDSALQDSRTDHELSRELTASDLDAAFGTP